MNKDIKNHQSDFDLNEIWTAIEPQVDEINAQRKKRKPIFLYWLSGVSMFVAIIIASFFLLVDKTQVPRNSNSNLPSEIIQTKAPVQVLEENLNMVIQENKTFSKIEKEVKRSVHSPTLKQNKKIKNNILELNTDFVEKTQESPQPPY